MLSRTRFFKRYFKRFPATASANPIKTERNQCGRWTTIDRVFSLSLCLLLFFRASHEEKTNRKPSYLVPHTHTDIHYTTTPTQNFEYSKCTPCKNRFPFHLLLLLLFYLIHQSTHSHLDTVHWWFSGMNVININFPRYISIQQ